MGFKGSLAADQTVKPPFRRLFGAEPLCIIQHPRAASATTGPIPLSPCRTVQNMCDSVLVCVLQRDLSGSTTF